MMNSGSVMPADPIDGQKSTTIYNAVVEKTGCAAAKDKLACLRAAPYDVFLGAVNSVPSGLSYQSLNLAYLPRPDGRYLTQSPEVLVKQGKYARVPFITGNQEDEGTNFALLTNNITNTDQVITYFAENYFIRATRAQVFGLVDAYTSDITQGSPFRTGIFNNIYPEFKRISAMLGDFAFTLTRRSFLSTVSDVSPNLPKWSYLGTYIYGTPVFGTVHGSDSAIFFEGIKSNYPSQALNAYYFSFINTLDPNTLAKTKGFPTWPQWTQDGTLLLKSQANGANLLKDDFRTRQYDAIRALKDVVRIQTSM